MTHRTTDGFAGLGLNAPLLRALAARNYTVPTPIQARAIPPLLEGRDLLGIAQTGTGKTAAFSLPMLQELTRSATPRRPRCPRALVLAPTRELATQIGDACAAYGRHLSLRHTVVFGGVGQAPQVHALRAGVDVLVATPGRLLDLMQQRHVSLQYVEFLVLDEADRMLDMGFLPDVRRILATLPEDRQSSLFSATMPADIAELARRILRDPLRVEVTPPAKTVDKVEQFVHFVDKAQKRDLLAHLLGDPDFERTLVFTRTRHGADRVVKHLRKAGIDAHAIHGDKSQRAREQALADFRSGDAPVLVATDIAARGIDVVGISHVVNFELPNVPESYVHRIGRTARAGRDGIAISLCDRDEREYLRDIERLIGRKVEPLPLPTFTATDAPPARPHPRRERETVPPAAKAPHPSRERPGRPRPHGPRHAHGHAAARGDRAAGPHPHGRGPGRRRRRSRGRDHWPGAPAAAPMVRHPRW